MQRKGHDVAEHDDALEREGNLDNLDQGGAGDGDQGDEASRIAWRLTGTDDSGDQSDAAGNDHGDDHHGHDDGDDEGFDVTFGDEAAPASKGENSDLVRHLREVAKRQAEEIATLRRAQPQQAAPIDPGPKPTLESCDYDGDKFEQELDAWKERNRKAEQAGESARQAQQAQQEEFQGRMQAYNAGKGSLKAKDFDVAEAAVTSQFSQEQVAVALMASEDPAKLVYALGRHPAKLAELVAIKDPIKFAAAIARLEGKITVTARGKTPPAPDTPQRGSGPLTGAKTDPVLEKLERDAARTGDRTEVVKYRRAQKEKAAKAAK